MTERRTRRRFLGGAAAAGAVALAGCFGDGSDGETTAPSDAGDEATRTATQVPESEEPATLATEADAQFRGGLRRRGYRPEVSLPSDPSVEWRVPGINKGDHTAAKASPVQGPDGRIVLPGDSGVVHALRPDGSVEWVAATDPSGRGIHGTPAIANDTVYIGAYDGALYAFDLETGERLWKASLGDAIGSSPAYHDGTVYIAVEFVDPDGEVMAIDAATGEVTWKSERPDDHPHSTVAIDRDAGKLVVGSNDGNCYAWEYPGLEDAWTFETGNAIKGPIAIHDGAAIFGSWDENVYRVDLDSGTADWRYPTDNYVMSGAAVDPEEGMVYVGGHDGYLHAIDAATGDREWRYRTGSWITGCPTVTADGILVGSYDTYLHAVDRVGETLWTSQNYGWVTSTPLPTDDGIYYAERATDDTSGGAYRIT